MAGSYLEAVRKVGAGHIDKINIFAEWPASGTVDADSKLGNKEIHTIATPIARFQWGWQYDCNVFCAEESRPVKRCLFPSFPSRCRVAPFGVTRADFSDSLWISADTLTPQSFENPFRLQLP
jgi:hypothetical protein